MKTLEEAGEDIRCGCGRLIARRKACSYEIKCPRCKEHHTLRCPEKTDGERPGSARTMPPS